MISNNDNNNNNKKFPSVNYLPYYRHHDNQF